MSLIDTTCDCVCCTYESLRYEQSIVMLRLNRINNALEIIENEKKKTCRKKTFEETILKNGEETS